MSTRFLGTYSQRQVHEQALLTIGQINLGVRLNAAQPLIERLPVDA